MAAVVAVEETSPPIAPDARIPHFDPITFERIYPAYSTAAIITTKNQILYGLKNFIYQIHSKKAPTPLRHCVIAKSATDPLFERKAIISANENFALGRIGRITKAITANLIVFPSSAREIFSRHL
jgi:hypothetical protein